MNGVVMNGLDWMFFFSFAPRPDGIGGAKFGQSEQVEASSPDTRAVITGILKDMVRIQDVLCGAHMVMSSISRSKVRRRRWSDCQCHC